MWKWKLENRGQTKKKIDKISIIFHYVNIFTITSSWFQSCQFFIIWTIECLIFFVAKKYFIFSRYVFFSFIFWCGGVFWMAERPMWLLKIFFFYDWGLLDWMKYLLNFDGTWKLIQTIGNCRGSLCERFQISLFSRGAFYRSFSNLLLFSLARVSCFCNKMANSVYCYYSSLQQILNFIWNFKFLGLSLITTISIHGIIFTSCFEIWNTTIKAN